MSGDGVPYYNTFDGDGWSGWSTYDTAPPAPVKYQPSVSVYDGKQHAVYTGDDGHAYYTAYDGSWSEWQDLGDNYAYDPYAYEYDDSLYVTYTGTDGYVYVKPYAAKDNGGYAAPTPTPGY